MKMVNEYVRFKYMIKLEVQNENNIKSKRRNRKNCKRRA